MPTHKVSREPWLTITNLQEVVMNKTVLSGAGWVDGRWYINGKYYSEEEVEYMLPTKFEYKVENPDGKNIPR